MQRLNESDILRVMREEWTKRITQITEKVNLVMHANASKSDSIISTGLKVRHKKSGIRYTVASVGVNDVILRTPEGDKFLVEKAQFEQDYELD